MERLLKRIKELEDRVAQLEGKRDISTPKFQPAQHVLIEFDKNISLRGVIADFVSECKGYSVFVPDRFQYVFVSEAMLSPDDNPPKTGLPNHKNVNSLKFQVDAVTLVEIHPEFTRWAESCQYCKILQTYPATKQYLVQVTDFDETRWDEGYDIVTQDRVCNIPINPIDINDVEIDQVILVDTLKQYGFWKAIKVGVLDGKATVRYLNKHTNKSLEFVGKSKVYEYPVTE